MKMFYLIYTCEGYRKKGGGKKKLNTQYNSFHLFLLNNVNYLWANQIPCPIDSNFYFIFCNIHTEYSIVFNAHCTLCGLVEGRQLSWAKVRILIPPQLNTVWIWNII